MYIQLKIRWSIQSELTVRVPEQHVGSRAQRMQILKYHSLSRSSPAERYWDLFLTLRRRTVLKESSIHFVWGSTRVDYRSLRLCSTRIGTFDRTERSWIGSTHWSGGVKEFFLPDRKVVTVMGRAPGNCDEKEAGLRKGPWTPDEDRKLVAYIQEHGHGSWRALPKNAGRHEPLFSSKTSTTSCIEVI